MIVIKISKRSKRKAWGSTFLLFLFSISIRKEITLLLLLNKKNRNSWAQL